MDKTKRKQKTKYLHKKSRAYREKYFKKIGAYEIYVQLAFIAQGILQYLSMAKRVGWPIVFYFTLETLKAF